MERHRFGGRSRPLRQIGPELAGLRRRAGRVAIPQAVFKLVVLSNADQATLAGSNRRLEGRFEAIFTAQELGACKPDPRLFEQMARRLEKQGVERRQILHVAHSLRRDQPAAACGLAFAWIDRRGQEQSGAAASEASDAPRWDFRFSNLVDMVKAHQQR